MIRPTIFNLLLHITPFASNDVWRRNISQLLRRMHVFNGKRIVGVATRAGGMPVVPLEKVQAEFGNERVDEWVMSDRCDNQQKHSPTLYPMMELVQNSDPRQATFYAHGKGISHPGSDVVTSWRNAMYHNLLGRMPEVAQLLSTHECAGTYKFNRAMSAQKHLTPAQGQCDWHYSGCFWWFRNDAVFTRDWQAVPMNGYAVEFYLPMLFKSSEAACIYNENPAWPYNKGAHRDWPDPPDWEAWLSPKLKPQITTRHLIYHLAPMTHNDVWIRNLTDLFSHLDIFNGRRIVGIVAGEGFHDPTRVTELLRRRGCETFVVQNDPWLREAKTFPELLDRVKDDSPHAALCYAHSKGVSLGLRQTTPGPDTTTPVRNPGVDENKITRWRRGLYRYNFEMADECLDMLERRSCVGSYRCTPRTTLRQNFCGGEFERGLTNTHHWHYAGSFFWARCDDLFSRDWRSAANIRHGWTTEAFPGNLFSMSESGCLESDTWLPREPIHFGQDDKENDRLGELVQEWEDLA